MKKETWPEQVLYQMQADENTKLSSKIRSMPSMRFQFWLYDCGLFEKTMAVSVSRCPLVCAGTEGPLAMTDAALDRLGSNL